MSRAFIALDLRMHPKLHGATRDRAVDYFVEDVRTAADRPPDLVYPELGAERPPEPNTLTDHLMAVLETGRSKAKHHHLEELSAIQDFHKRLESISCKACALAAEGEACSGRAGDDQVLARAGHCWAPFKLLFEALVELAERTYSPIANVRDLELDLRLVTQVSRGGVDGFTRFPKKDSSAARAAEVVIGLPSEKLNERHMGRLPYVMFHEIFVHGPENWGGHGRREPGDEANAFREGFVDSAAHEVLRQYLLSNRKLPPPFDTARDPILDESQLAHFERIDPGDPEDTTRAGELRHSCVSCRRKGKRIFERYAHGTSWERAVRFAARMNLVPLSIEQQADLLSVLDYAADVTSWDDELASHDGPRWLDLKGKLESAAAGEDAGIVALLDNILDPRDF